MNFPKPRIDTSSVADKGAFLSGIPIRNDKRPSPLRTLPDSNIPKPRIRTNSSASTTSSLSIVTPRSTSTNASSPSNLSPPHSARSPLPSSPRSPSFPSSRSRAEYVYTMHDYAPQNQNSGCLSFRAGQAILVLNRDPSGWWDGELDGQRGWFPSNYVNSEADYCLGENSHTETRRNAEITPAGNIPHDGCEPSPPSGGGEGHSDLVAESNCSAWAASILSLVAVMQETVRMQKVNHYLPSARVILKHVRHLLSIMGVRDKTSPILKRYPRLAEGKKDLYSFLNPLIHNAFKAMSTPQGTEHDSAVEAMLRCTAEICNRSRLFLILWTQHGFQVPEPPPPDGSAIWSTQWTDGGSLQVSLTNVQSASDTGDVSRTPTQHGKRRYRPATPRAKSLGDLRLTRNKSLAPTASAVPPLPQREESSNPRQREQTLHNSGASVSSTSSSSLSTPDEAPKLMCSTFPCGSATARQVLSGFIHTHNVFLSTSTAFIGLCHAYSQETHASTKVQICELGNEITDLACKLLTLADAIIHHPDIPKQKHDHLSSSQQNLFRVVNSFAESVQSIASVKPPTTGDEQQKGDMIKASTDSIKAAADCFSAAKVCLTHPDSFHRPFVIKSFDMQERYSNRGDHTVMDGTVCDEDDTVQVPIHPLALCNQNSASGTENRLSSTETSIARSISPVGKVPCPIMVPDLPIEPDFPSPTSLVRTDDGTTWEGSTRNLYTDRVLAEKDLHGELPPAPMGFMPEFHVNPYHWLLSHDYGQDDVAYNSEGLLVGATLDALVEKMTPHDSIVDSAFSAVFFLTFRLFATPLELVEKIIQRYHVTAPDNLPQEDFVIWEQRKGLPVRLRISNFIKIWVEFYWRPGFDDSAIPLLSSFVSKDLSFSFPGAAQRVLELLDQRRHSLDLINTVSDRTRDPGMSINPPLVSPTNVEIPRPIMTKTLLASLRRKDWTSIAVTDFDAMELARQLTIMECNLYCAIQPEEILETGQQGTKSPVNVKALTSLSTAITGWVAECILNETDIKRRSLNIKFFIKVADRCAFLNNYSTPRSILAALDSSTISRLHQTWLGVPQKQKSMFDSLRRLADHGRNYYEYRNRLRNTAPPAVPFLGLYLTDVTFCREGNPSHRASPTDPSKSLLNFNKYHKLARIVQDMQRFQVHYNLKAIPEVQEYLNVCFENARNHGDLQDLYRRSLLVEPKQPADSLVLGEVRQLFGWATRSQSQAQATTS